MKNILYFTLIMFTLVSCKKEKTAVKKELDKPSYAYIWCEKKSDVKNNPHLYPCDKVTKLNHKSTVVMQFTGLKDKNGVEIYEGYIVEWQSTFKGASQDLHTDCIEWDDGGACFALMPWLHEPYAAEMKVIGNIHENPELLDNP